jgi:hypothetical protein
MSDTIRKGTIVTQWGRYCRYWMRHAPAWYRRGLNHSFREQEKQYFLKFGEYLRPVKNRGYWW